MIFPLTIYPANRTSARRATVAAALLAVGIAAPMSAQDPDDENGKHMRIASTYRLTEPVLKKYQLAMRELLALARKDPSVAAEQDDDKPMEPRVAAIFKRAGLTEDEVEKFGIAMAYAQMASMGASMSGEAEREMAQAPPVMRANVAFLKTHESALKALGADMKALQAIGEGKTDVAGEVESASEMKVTGALRGGLNSEIDLEVTGGRHAGRYTAKVSEGGCSYGLAKKGAWGNQYSVNTKDPTKFSSLQLIVPDGKVAAGGTQKFQLIVSFGPLLSLREGGHYTIETTGDRDREGQGTLRVQDSGAGATITFDGKTKQGVGLKGTIRCHSVMRVE